MVSCSVSYEESLAQWQRSHPCVVCVSLQGDQECWGIEVIALSSAELQLMANQDQPIEQSLYQLLAYERLVVADKQRFFAEIELRLITSSPFTDHVVKQLKHRTTAIGFDKRYRTAQQLRNDYINAQLSRLKSHRH